MRKGLTFTAVVILLAGCGLLGPSPKDVKEALDAVGNGLKASASCSPKISSEYSNSADISASSPDGSVAIRAKILMDSAHALFISGTCTFSGYRDKATGYTLDGTVRYKFDDIREGDPDAMTGEIACDVAMTGGKIETLEVTLSKGKDGNAVTDLVADGKKIDLEAWDKAQQMMRAIAPSLVEK